MSNSVLLEVSGLKTYFYTDDGVAKAVDGVDFEIYPGETLGVVGESGSGKSVTALSIMRLIHDPPGKIEEGQVLLEGTSLLDLDINEVRHIRGNDISMIFQEPMTSLDPVFTIGDQISESLREHRGMTRKDALDATIEMLKKVGIPLPEQRVNEFPHQLSGGMRQRVMIAMALCCNPKLVIADEPTTALDVTIQAQILELMLELKETYNMAIMMITHDLGVIAEISDRVAVMYAGKIVEYSDTHTIFGEPMHPYTWGLLNSIPRLDKDVEELIAIPGIVPSALHFPTGCRYHTRCLLADGACKTEIPQLTEVRPGHQVRCLHHDRIDVLKSKSRSA